MSTTSIDTESTIQVAAIRINNDADFTASCGRKISQLKSCTSVQAYTKEFRNLASNLSWNDAALRHYYYEGLQDQIKDTLVIFDTPKTLEELITVSENICSRQNNRQKERDSPRNFQIGHDLPGQKRNLSSSAIWAQKVVTDGNPVSTIGIKLLSHSTLTDCISYQRPILRAAIPEDDSNLNEHLIIPVTLSFDGTDVKTTAMIDHGAQVNLIDHAYATALKIPMIERKVPLAIQGFDGQLSTRSLKYYTHVMELKVGEHCELIEFNVGDIAYQPIILGIPWVRTHDMIASLGDNTVTFMSEYCATHCLPSMSRVNL